MANPESATARLGRLLTMVPWLVNRQGIDIAEAAQELGVTTEQVEADLALLFVCGTPGHMPDDLIEAEWEEGRVFLRNAETIARPLRLGLDEATALIVGLRTLAAVPGLGERDAVDRALAKLVEAAGDSGAASDRVRIALESEVPSETLTAMRAAVAGHKRLHLHYVVPSRDETTERDVDPMRVVSLDGNWYLEGWCHRANDVRLFRLDRVAEVEVLDVDGTPPTEARPRDLGSGLFTPGPDDLTAVVELSPDAAWVVDYYPVDTVERGSDGVLTATFRTADLRWLRQLMWRLGESARVLEPVALRTEVADGARAALAAYQS
ncbi:helix-turn-helix transcriptional regulator [Flexivirga alba]|uniref:Helix-turn-helix transcriptional regulator n=1 Tax=Flexivirga alba TaxID=702742 RepID=A0ABW2AJN8_9MICO